MATRPSGKNVAQVLKGYTALNESQKLEFKKILNEYDSGYASQQSDLLHSITEAMASTGPMDSNACKCCGKS